MNLDLETIRLPKQIMDEMSKTVIGKESIRQTIFVALIAGGHVLIEGLPGTAKTKVVSTLAQIVGCPFNRIQFTPDMMPADITGFYLYSMVGEPRFVEGPMFANIVLADELNRTTPRTQAALLEAMQEHQVTIEGQTYKLHKPFMVIATQVDTGAEGTYPLADVQLDRFMLRAHSEYASFEEEVEIVANIDYIDNPELEPIISTEDIVRLQESARQVYVARDIVEYIVSIIDTLRRHPDTESGPSSRGSIALFKCARALALIEERDFVIPDDVKRLVIPALEHRIKMKGEAEMDEIAPKQVLKKIMEQTPVPRIKS